MHLYQYLNYNSESKKNDISACENMANWFWKIKRYYNAAYLNLFFRFRSCIVALREHVSAKLYDLVCCLNAFKKRAVKIVPVHFEALDPSETVLYAWKLSK